MISACVSMAIKWGQFKGTYIGRNITLNVHVQWVYNNHNNFIETRLQDTIRK